LPEWRGKRNKMQKGKRVSRNLGGKEPVISGGKQKKNIWVGGNGPVGKGMKKKWGGEQKSEPGEEKNRVWGGPGLGMMGGGPFGRRRRKPKGEK